MGKFSRDKGKRYEREAVDLLKSLGYEARRSSQYQGVVDEELSADIVHNIPLTRVEVKGGYNDNFFIDSLVQRWIDTCEEETPEGFRWLILWKKARRKWGVIYKQDGILNYSEDIELVISK